MLVGVAGLVEGAEDAAMLVVVPLVEVVTFCVVDEVGGGLLVVATFDEELETPPGVH